MNQQIYVYLMKLPVEKFMSRPTNNTIIGSPDIGSGKRADAVARLCNTNEDICLVWKIHDPETKKVDLKKSKVFGDVEGKTVWFFDDLIQSFSTLEIAGKIVKEAGAKKIISVAVHPDFIPSSNGQKSTVQKINDSSIDEIIVIDTIPIDKTDWSDKITVIDPAPMIAECILSLHFDKPLSKHFLKY